LVPDSVILKRFGRDVLAEELNKLVNTNVDKYLKENKMRVVGDLLPRHEDIELEPGRDFDFEFEVGYVPDFSVNLSPHQSFTRYNVFIEDELIDKSIEEMRFRFGNIEHPAIPGPDDYLGGNFVQLDEKGEVLPGGIFNFSYINLKKVPANQSKDKFLGLKEGDSVTFTLSEITDKEEEACAILEIPAEKGISLSTPFRFTLKAINHIVPAEVNQEWWDKVYGKGKVNNIEDFRNTVKMELSRSYSPESERHMENEMMEYLVKNTPVILPEKFLKKWMAQKQKDAAKNEISDAEFESYTKAQKMSLIAEKIISANNLTVTKEEAHQFAHSLAHSYLGHSATEAQVEDAAHRLLASEKEVNRIYDRLYDMKLLELLKKNFTIITKEVSKDEFEKAMNNKE
jgi:trigger factor